MGLPDIDQIADANYVRECERRVEMETRFTKGPWSIEKCASHCGYENCDYHWISSGSFSQGTGFNKADADLIAQAPAMYELIQELLGMHFLPAHLDSVSNSDIGTRLENILSQARGEE